MGYESHHSSIDWHSMLTACASVSDSRLAKVFAMRVGYTRGKATRRKLFAITFDILDLLILLERLFTSFRFPYDPRSHSNFLSSRVRQSPEMPYATLTPSARLYMHGFICTPGRARQHKRMAVSAGKVVHTVTHTAR